MRATTCTLKCTIHLARRLFKVWQCCRHETILATLFRVIVSAYENCYSWFQVQVCLSFSTLLTAFRVVCGLVIAWQCKRTLAQTATQKCQCIPTYATLQCDHEC